MDENKTMADFAEELEASYGRMYVWDRLEAMMENQENVTVEITEVAKGGVVAFLEGVRGFIPASKLALEYVEENTLKKYLHQSLEVRIIDIDEEQRRLILSAREILKESEEAERLKKISEVKVGSILEGVVESLKAYGAFIDLGNGMNGLLHISQICKNRIKHPGVVLSEGQTVTVLVTGNEDGKLSLSMRALEETAEREAEEEVVEIPEAEEVTTSLGALLSGLKL
jgi:small subunit ribosomal protein S1